MWRLTLRRTPTVVLAPLVLAMLALTACSGSAARERQRPDGVATVAASASALATAKPTTASRPAAPLVTNSGISLGSAMSAPISEQGPEPDLRQFQTQKGTAVLVPSTWASQAPVSISQNVCADTRCVQLQESLQLFVSANSQEAIGVMSIALPLDAPADASALLPGAIRGSIAAISAAGASGNTAEPPQTVTVANASRALSARAAIVDPTTGMPATVTVVAASGEHEIDALIIGVSDAYLRAHQALFERIRSSFSLGGPVQ